MKKRFLLSGGWAYGNIGDEAILHCAVENLKSTFGDIEITITSYNPEDTYFHHKLNSYPSLHRLIQTNPKSFLKKVLSLLLWSKTRNKRFLYKELSRYIDLVSESDVVVMAGGGYFNDVWLGSFISRYLEILICKSLNKPFFITGQTVGPFEKIWSKILIKGKLNKIDGIVVRDIQSKRALEKLNLNKEIFLSADEANAIAQYFPLKQKRRKVKDHLCVGIMVQKFRPYVGADGTKEFIRSDDELYYKSFSKIIDELIQKYNAKINFLPSTSWDIEACYKVIQHSQNKNLLTVYPWC